MEGPRLLLGRMGVERLTLRDVFLCRKYGNVNRRAYSSRARNRSDRLPTAAGLGPTFDQNVRPKYRMPSPSSVRVNAAKQIYQDTDGVTWWDEFKAWDGWHTMQHLCRSILMRPLSVCGTVSEDRNAERDILAIMEDEDVEEIREHQPRSLQAEMTLARRRLEVRKRLFNPGDGGQHKPSLLTILKASGKYPAVEFKKGDFTPEWRRHELFSQILSPYSISEHFASNERPRISIFDIAPGCILWLPNKDELSPKALSHGHRVNGLAEGGFNHPVLVLDVNLHPPDEGLVSFVLLTTFGRSGGQSKLRDSAQNTMITLNGQTRKSVEWQLPIVGQGQDPTSSPDVLMLERGHWSLERNSFVKLNSGVFGIHFSQLRCYRKLGAFTEASRRYVNGWSYRLSEKSFEFVARHLGFTPQPWLKTHTPIWENFLEQVLTPQDLDSCTPKSAKLDVRSIYPIYSSPSKVTTATAAAETGPGFVTQPAKVHHPVAGSAGVRKNLLHRLKVWFS
jgi:hypothetical protein